MYPHSQKQIVFCLSILLFLEQFSKKFNFRKKGIYFRRPLYLAQNWRKVENIAEIRAFTVLIKAKVTRTIYVLGLGSLDATLQYSSLYSGIAHAMALGLGPWLAVEIPELVEKGVITYKEKATAWGITSSAGVWMEELLLFNSLYSI